SKSLRDSGQCSRFSGLEGEVVVPIRHQGNVMFVDVMINKKAAVLVLDTGASTVALSREFANRIGLDTSKGSRGVVTTASGLARVTRVQLDSVAVGSASLQKVGATVLNSMRLGNADGLLGNSFLSHFDVRVDSAKSRLILKKR
ncbi:MAG TPA: TIGR02281 family clan AA aspartic protease, partial [Myxococcales bacterium]|nr:TIGR02281 family clan AA aspartic protease [Myxococcales bacterium]